MYKNYFKRLLDLIIASIAFIIFLPIIIITGLVVAIGFRENPFFLHQRPGKNERIFSVIKFKTMNNKKDAMGNLLSDTERLTPLGIAIRKTSLDELPQLINVIKGDMSIIGPRPLLIRYLPYYRPQEKRRHEVRPGITGLAQIKGRNFISWEDKFKWDVHYIDNLSFLLDMKIIWKTLLKVLSPGDIEVDPNSNPVMLAVDIQRRDWPEFKHLKKNKSK